MTLIDPLSNVAEFFISVFDLLPLSIKAFFSLALGTWFAVGLFLWFHR